MQIHSVYIYIYNYCILFIYVYICLYVIKLNSMYLNPMLMHLGVETVVMFNVYKYIYMVGDGSYFGCGG